jgi:hypothetical protein
MRRQVTQGQWVMFVMGAWEWECTHAHAGEVQWWASVGSEEAAVTCIKAHNVMHHPHIEVHS